MTTYKPKLIEVALPLAAINEACAHEKTVKHGHPSNLHLYWARRPLAAARAVLWASLVDDPSADPTLDDAAQTAERERLFDILSKLVRWENAGDQELLGLARAEVLRCYPNGLPEIVDPFGGGGAICLEAQRLGLPAMSGDINPLAVLIQRAVTEIPSRFAGQPPISTEPTLVPGHGSPLAGLAEDVHHYGLVLRDTVAAQLEKLYPKVNSPEGRQLDPIAWIWARTVESPDPTWRGHVPLAASWILSKRPGKPTVWIDPVVDHSRGEIRYELRHGGTPVRSASISRGVGTCIATGATIPADYIKAEGVAGRLGVVLMAVVADGPTGRVFVEPTPEQVAATAVTPLEDRISGAMSRHPQYMGTPRYGLDEWWKLFTPRQLVALESLSRELQAMRRVIVEDACKAGLVDDGVALRDGGSGATAYGDAIVTYLALTLDKLADLANSLCRWEPVAQCPRQLFGRQAVSMVWDFAEGNPFGGRSGSFEVLLDGQRRVLAGRGLAGGPSAVAVHQRDARATVSASSDVVVSTDPPYYDAVPYADISDFFYVWLRRSLSQVWPDECATLLTPKAEEMVADYQRNGSKEGAERFFESSMAAFMQGVASAQRQDTPATIYYAYKSTESSDGETRSTGWDTFLKAILDAGLQVTATWPLRTENASRLRAMKSNALASSIVLACRPRPVAASLASQGEFVAALRDELPHAVKVLQSGNIAPVDLAQSTIGPGIKVFSRYAKVVEADGSAMSVSDALAIINDVLGEVIDGEEAELDADTRFATTWYAQQGYNPGRSGDADGQARAKNTSLSGIEAAGIGEARGGSFRLFERSELNPEWDVVADSRLTVWEATQHLVAALDRSETEAADLLHRLGGYGDRARQLAYVLFQKATDKGWAEEAGAYNGLILAWPTLQSMGSSTDHDQQQRLL